MFVVPFRLPVCVVCVCVCACGGGGGGCRWVGVSVCACVIWKGRYVQRGAVQELGFRHRLLEQGMPVHKRRT